MNGPVYIRLTGAAGLPVVYDKDFDYEIGKAVTLREGKDVTLIATGSMVYYSLEAAKMLAANGITPALSICIPLSRSIKKRSRRPQRRQA